MDSPDALLKKLNLTLDDLTKEEQEYYLSRLKTISNMEVSLSDVRKWIRGSLNAIELELADTPETETFFFGLFHRPNSKHIALKARMKNYLMQESFIESPQKARQALEQSLSSIK